MARTIAWAALVPLIVATLSIADAETLNLSNRTDKAGSFEIAFCARPSPDTLLNLPGHLFVAFSHERPDGKRDFRAIGHTVSGGVGAALWSLWGVPVSGYLSEERYTHVQERCLVAIVNREDYEQAYSRTLNPLASLGVGKPTDIVFQDYRLNAEDCVTFVLEVAKDLEPRGLVVPTRGAIERPMDYVGRLIEAN